ncbi:MAG: hypothetical protein DWP97_08720 [Calditrichaeota bacterium]|nr:MAG: hypothetical protein DWP97_08720 [Calditrichota bacterium]
MNIDKIKQLLQERKYKDVISIIDINKAQIDLENVELLIYYTEASLALGEYESRFIDKAIALLRPTNDIGSFALAKYLKARLEIISGELLSAQENLNESYVYYKRLDDLRGMARASNLLSYIAFQQGNYITFDEHSQRSIYYYKKLKLNDKIGMVLLNQCLAQFRRGNFKKTNLILNEVRLNFIQYLTDDNLYNLYHISILKNCLIDNLISCKEQLELTNQLSKDLKREVFRQHEITALYYYYKKDFNKSEEIALKGLDLAEKIASQSTLISQIKRLLGDVYIKLNDYTKAEKYASEALLVAEKINERVEIAACYRIFGQVEMHKKNKTKAKDWFEQACQLFAKIQSNYELAVTRYLSAESGLYTKAEQSALLYPALDYFKSEEITAYIEKIEKVLNNLTTDIAPIVRKQTDRFACPKIITKNKQMHRLLDYAKQTSVMNDTILITGDTGTGKELFAQYIHYHSNRKGQLVTVNAATIPETMFESELFGYEKGAFTGANKSKPGKFELANGGTLFLDEIGELPLNMQAKLLRVLEEKKVERLGGIAKKDINVKIIAATNKNLKEFSEKNIFRSDLYFRLQVFEIALPPLCDRLEDIEPLVSYFLEEYGFDVEQNREKVTKLADIFETSRWNGNIRELENELKRLYLLSEKSIDQMLKIYAPIQNATHREKLADALEKTNWNRREAARLLNVSESSVRRWIEKYNLHEPINIDNI